MVASFLCFGQHKFGWWVEFPHMCATWVLDLKTLLPLHHGGHAILLEARSWSVSKRVLVVYMLWNTNVGNAPHLHHLAQTFHLWIMTWVSTCWYTQGFLFLALSWHLMNHILIPVWPFSSWYLPWCQPHRHLSISGIDSLNSRCISYCLLAFFDQTMSCCHVTDTKAKAMTKAMKT